MNKRIEASVIETRESEYSVTINVNGFDLVGDEPEDFGGKNLGPAPYDYLLAALGECTAMTVRWFAIQRGWPLDRVRVEVSHELKDRKSYFTKKIHVEGPQLTPEQQQKLIEVGAKCPVHKTLLSEVTIETLDA